MYPNGKPKTVAINHRGIHIQDDGHVCLFCEAFPVAVTDDDDDDDSSEYYSTSSTTSSKGSLEQPHEGSSNRYKRRNEGDEEEKEPVIDEDKTMEETEEDEGRERKGRRKASEKQPQKPTKRRRRRKRVGTTTPTTPHNIANLLQREVLLQYLPIAVCQFDIHGKLHYQNPEALHIFGWPTKTTTTIATSNDDGISTGESVSDDVDSNAVGNPSDGGNDGSTEKNPPIPKEAIPLDKQKELENEMTSEAASGVTSDGGRSYDNDFVNRFVDRKEGIQLFEQIISGNDVNVEALVHTKRGPGWNAIHARLGKPMESGGNHGSRSGGKKKSKSNKKNNKNNRTSNNNNYEEEEEEEKEEEPHDGRMILFSARDISEIITAKREMQLSLERAEFFAIMVSIIDWMC